MKTYHIYRLINTADNDKSYIGQTGQKDPTKRFNRCQYKGRLIKAAIDKFGWQSFKHEILASTTRIATANKLERMFIKQFDTLNPEHGYNIQRGGSFSRRGYHRSIAATKKQSAAISKKVWYWNPKTNEQFRLSDEEANSFDLTDFIRGKRKPSSTMQRIKWYYNPKTNETIRLLPEAEVPSGFVPGRGNFHPTNPFGHNN